MCRRPIYQAFCTEQTVSQTQIQRFSEYEVTYFFMGWKSVRLSFSDKNMLNRFAIFKYIFPAVVFSDICFLLSQIADVFVQKMVNIARRTLMECLLRPGQKRNCLVWSNVCLHHIFLYTFFLRFDIQHGIVPAFRRTYLSQSVYMPMCHLVWNGPTLNLIFIAVVSVMAQCSISIYTDDVDEGCL